MMKSIVRVLSSILIVVLFMFSIVIITHAAETVYVSGAGNDSNSGLSKDAAVATLEQAFTLLNGAGGNIVVCGDLSVGPENDDYRALQNLPQTGLVTISCADGATITVPGKGIWLYSNTVIENAKLNFTYTGYSAYLVADGYSLTIGKNVDVNAADRYPIIYGGGFYSFLTVPDGADSNVTVESGRFEAVFGGGGAHCTGSHEDDIDGNVTINIKGGEIGTVYGGGNGGGDAEVFIGGNEIINVSGGTIGDIYASGATSFAVIKGNANVNITGGTITGKIACYTEGVEGSIKGTSMLTYSDNKYKDISSGFGTSEYIAPVTIFYVSGAGNDSNSGLSKDAAVATLEQAFTLLNGAGGNIVVCGDLSVGPENDDYRALQNLPQTGLVTISCADGATITVPGKGIWLYSNTVIENAKLNFTYTGYSAYLVADGYSLTIGKNVDVNAADRYPIIYGGGFYSFLTVPDGADSTVTVESGRFEAVFGGGGAHCTGSHEDDIDGNATINIKGGEIGIVYGGGNGGGDAEVFIGGNEIINVSGGTIGDIYASGVTSFAVINGNANVNITGGTITGKIACYAEGTEGSIKGTSTLTYNDNKYKDISSGFSAYISTVPVQSDPQTTPTTDNSTTQTTPTTNNSTTQTTPTTSNTTEQETPAANNTTESVTSTAENNEEQTAQTARGATEQSALMANNTTEQTVPKTGDTSSNMGIIYIIISAFMVVSIFVTIRLKKNNSVD